MIFHREIAPRPARWLKGGRRGLTAPLSRVRRQSQRKLLLHANAEGHLRHRHQRHSHWRRRHQRLSRHCHNQDRHIPSHPLRLNRRHFSSSQSRSNSTSSTPSRLSKRWASTSQTTDVFSLSTNSTDKLWLSARRSGTRLGTRSPGIQNTPAPSVRSPQNRETNSSDTFQSTDLSSSEAWWV